MKIYTYILEGIVQDTLADPTPEQHATWMDRMNDEDDGTNYIHIFDTDTGDSVTERPDTVPCMKCLARFEDPSGVAMLCPDCAGQPTFPILAPRPA